MSDHPREAERNLKRIRICDDVWYNVFDWTSRADLGLKIAPISPGFDALVGRHLRGIRRWTIGHIGFRRSIDDSRAVVWKGGNLNSGVLLEDSALLDVPPPSSLIGFRLIEIRYVDKNVITFLHRICHLFNTVDTTLMLLHFCYSDSWSKTTTHLLPLIARLYKLIYNYYFDGPLLFLRDCANLRVIHADFVFPEMPADDGADASPGQELAKWMHRPRSDGLPKVFKCEELSVDIAKKMEGLKTTFINAESPVAYIIYVRTFEPNVGSFEFVNERTRERMTFERTDSSEQYCEHWLLKRGPFWWGKSEWAESECQAKALIWKISEEMNLIRCEQITFDENI